MMTWVAFASPPLASPLARRTGAPGPTRTRPAAPRGGEARPRSEVEWSDYISMDYRVYSAGSPQQVVILGKARARTSPDFTMTVDPGSLTRPTPSSPLGSPSVPKSMSTERG